MSFEELLTSANALQKSMEEAVATTKLPSDIDQEAVDVLLLAMLREGVP